jgi:hypothetical protein
VSQEGWQQPVMDKVAECLSVLPAVQGRIRHDAPGSGGCIQGETQHGRADHQANFQLPSR